MLEVGQAVVEFGFERLLDVYGNGYVLARVPAAGNVIAQGKGDMVVVIHI